MLFRKNMPRSCSYCIHGTKLNEDEVLCVKKGIVNPLGNCRRFSYEPCKRIPPKPKTQDFKIYDNEDFSL